MSAEPTAPNKERPNKTNWIALVQLVFSFLIFLGFIGGAVFLSSLQVGFGSLLGEYLGNPGAWKTLSIALFTLALFCVPSVISSGYALSNLPQPRWLRAPRKKLNWLPLALLALIVGVLLRSRLALSEASLGVLTTLAIVLPAIWLLRIGAGEQWGKHPQRNAGLLTFSIGFTPFFIMILEVILVLIIIVALSLFLVNSSQWAQILNDFMSLYSEINPNPEDLLQAFSALANSRQLLAWLLFLAALVIPLIEEAFKTLGVWLLSGQNITPAEGFVAGLACGAGFAILEGLLNSMQIVGSSSNDWLAFVLGRFGGTLLHILNGGLLGWALASRWQKGKHSSIFGIYLLAVLLHGVWNALTIFTFTTGLSYLFLDLFAGVILVGFILFSRSIHRQAATNPAESPGQAAS